MSKSQQKEIIENDNQVHKEKKRTNKQENTMKACLSEFLCMYLEVCVCVVLWIWRMLSSGGGLLDTGEESKNRDERKQNWEEWWEEGERKLN